jgi:hypothetical protein
LVILEIFGIILLILEISGLFWPFWCFQGYFGHFDIFGGVLVILVFPKYFRSFGVDTSRTFVHPTEDIGRHYTLPSPKQRIENDDAWKTLRSSIAQTKHMEGRPE